MSGLLSGTLSVINVGLNSFADAIAANSGTVTRVQWEPPGGEPAAARAVALLAGRKQVDQANQAAFERYIAAEPVIEGIALAREVIPRMGERTLLHSGPPLPWARMGGTLQGAAVGAILLEGWARDAEAARAMAERGEIALGSCHEHDAVGPMAGVTSPSMPVWIVRNRTHGNRAFCNLNEGLGKVLRYGANGPEVIERLKWMGRVLGPTLEKTLIGRGPIALKPLMARALQMGDEMHNRNAAASALLFKQLAPGLLRAEVPGGTAAEVLEFINGNDHFFLNVAMAACKAMLEAAAGVEASSMVVVMARNGTEFGIRLSGTGSRWFTATAPYLDGLFFAGYSKADASRDIGDSAITETAGLGGFAMAAAPAIVQFVGGTPRQAVENTLAMGHITVGSHPAFTIPALDFRGVPAGIDARKVVDRRILPIINSGIAHREAGIGQIGAGITNAPMACFSQAIVALAQQLESQDRESASGGAEAMAGR
jgi:hypothetical protein